MKRVLNGLIVAGMILLYSGVGSTQEDFPVISANGFSCSQTNRMITCRGNFPGSSSPTIESTGYNVIWIRGEYPDKRFTYYSDSGCLCQTEFKSSGSVKEKNCTSRFGKTKRFKGKKDHYKWCRDN